VKIFFPDDKPTTEPKAKSPSAKTKSSAPSVPKRDQESSQNSHTTGPVPTADKAGVPRAAAPAQNDRDSQDWININHFDNKPEFF